MAGLFMSRRRALGLAALFAATAAIVGGTGLPTHGVAQETGASVPFDHAIHAGQYDMTCLGCHVYAAHSPSAGLPSVRKCMGCHKFIAKDKPGVQALAALFEQGQPPRWLRVTRLPDFIYFSHRMHVRSNVACSDCHGEVKAMHTVVPAARLTMGICLGCHGARNATVDCVACHK